MNSKVANWIVFLVGTFVYFILGGTSFHFVGVLSLIAASVCLGNLNLFRIPDAEWLSHLGLFLVFLLLGIFLPSFVIVSSVFLSKVVFASCILLSLASFSRIYWFWRQPLEKMFSESENQIK